MVFASIEFLWLFMPVALVAYLAVAPRWRNVLLACLSLVFYVWGAHALVFLFLASIGGNYVAGRLIERARARADDRGIRRVMWVAVTGNLALLVFWKYADFAVGQLDELLGTSGLGVGFPDVLLPIGISFYTFHGVSYVVDCARGQARPLRSVADYAQYMAFFPQLIAGPIIRYHEIEDQLRTPPPRSKRWDDVAEGFPRFALGLSKKVLIADPAGAIADACFAQNGDLSTRTAWLGALAYTVQIYFDFSGYTDMAIGLARFFGFRFPENFDRPYSSISMTDFWRRWHMTLSRWFRDYVYIPLGGSRGSQATTIRNLMFVFLLTGAWHGADWTFMLWGVYNGALLVVERLTGVRTWAEDRLVAVRRAVTFLLVVFGWVLFRATSLGEVGDFWQAMVVPTGGGLPAGVDQALNTETVIALSIGLASVLLPRGFVMGRIVQSRWTAWSTGARAAVLLILPWTAITVAAGSFSPFLYFQF